MTSKYERYGIKLPNIVEKANRLATELGFPLLPEGRSIGHEGPASACIPAMGKLLSVLVSGYPDGVIAEYGTGPGVGTAWMACGLSLKAKLYSAEFDEQLVKRAKELFADYPNVEIRHGDCFKVLLDLAPFDLLFMDAGVRHYLTSENWDTVTELVKVGGKIIFDDLIPLEQWPPEWNDLIDVKREFAFNNSRVIGTTIRTTATQAAIIVTRIK